MRNVPSAPTAAGPRGLTRSLAAGALTGAIAGALTLVATPAPAQQPTSSASAPAAEASADSSAAARAKTRRPIWVNAGIVGGSDDLLGLGLSLTFAPAPHRVITVRALSAGEFCICSTPDGLAEAGLLYGMANQSRWGVASVAAGAGLAYLQRTDPTGNSGPPYFRTTERVTVSLPLEAQLFFRPLPFLGLGGVLLADLNPVRSMTGLQVSVQLGRLRPRWGDRTASAPAPR